MKYRFFVASLATVAFYHNTCGQCGPQSWWDSLWYGINGGACYYGEPTPTFFPSFPKCNNRPYVLIFHDAFNGTQLDGRVWYEYVSPQGKLTNNPAQEYNSLDNVSVSNGICTITARRQNISARAIPYYPDNEILEDGLQNLRTFNFTSANLWTKFRFGFGKYIIKYKVDIQPGMWPAFWGYNKDNGIWNEVDWYELTGNHPNRWTGTLHHDRYGDGCEHFCVNGVNDAADFSQWHIFNGEYQFDHISWSLDGSLLDYRTRYYTSASNVVECGENIANNILFEPAYWPLGKFPIIFNLAVYRHDPEAPSETFNAASYDVDYIEHYVQDGCCGNLFISNTEMLGMSSDLTDYNYLCAKSMVVSDNVHISEGENMAFVAVQTVTFYPGFSADAGSYVTTILQPDVTPCCDIHVTSPLPNVFTPNGDGVNDNYCIHVVGATNFNVFVLDQWGNTIYSGSGIITPDQDPVCIWDGDGAQSGYAYAIAIELSNTCSGDEPVRVGTTTHVYRDAPGLIMKEDVDSINYTNVYYQLSKSSDNNAYEDTSSQFRLGNYVHENMTNDWNFIIQPNPTDMEFTVILTGITTSSAIRLRLFDMRGVDVKITYDIIYNTIRTNTRDLPSGVYWIEIDCRNSIKTHKLVIIH